MLGVLSTQEKKPLPIWVDLRRNILI